MEEWEGEGGNRYPRRTRDAMHTKRTALSWHGKIFRDGSLYRFTGTPASGGSGGRFHANTGNKQEEYLVESGISRVRWWHVCGTHVRGNARARIHPARAANHRGYVQNSSENLLRTLHETRDSALHIPQTAATAGEGRYGDAGEQDEAGWHPRGHTLQVALRAVPAASG